MHLHLHLTLILVYSAVLIGLGLWIGRRVTGAAHFFVAGRSLPAGLVFATVLAANIGAGSTVGATGLAYQHGLSAWWWNGAAGLGSLLLAVWIGPRIWRLAADRGYYTVGDFLEDRYGRQVRGLVAVLIWLGTLSILAGQLIGVAWILNTVIGVPKWAGCLIGGSVMTLYFTAGGLLGSAWVNLLQLGVLLVGFLVAMPLIGSAGGGWVAILGSHTLPPGFTEFWGGQRSLGFLILLVPAFIISPGLLQKAFGGRSPRAVRLGIGANGLVLLVFAFVPALLGIAARVRFPDLPHHELALPMLLAQGLPAAVGALALAAVFSAEVSTCDAILFMLATSLSQDLYRRFVNPSATEADVLRVARISALAGGTLGVGLAVLTPSIIEALSIFYTLLGVSLLVPVVAGLHAHPPARAALASIVAGVGAVLVTRWLGMSSLSLPGLSVAAITFALAGGLRRSARA